ncbi:hypothetical protein [Prevotella sp. P2-180]|nr:hypothetical protein [Prevotella sp. P2-180]
MRRKIIGPGQGTPETVSGCKESITGHYLKEKCRTPAVVCSYFM